MWRVRPELVHSDHFAITFEMAGVAGPDRFSRVMYCLRQADWERFSRMLQVALCEEELDTLEEEGPEAIDNYFDAAIRVACDLAIPRKRLNRMAGGGPAWWTRKLAGLKAELNRAIRTMQVARRQQYN